MVDGPILLKNIQKRKFKELFRAVLLANNRDFLEIILSKMVFIKELLFIMLHY
jgi:hypothetical protein